MKMFDRVIVFILLAVGLMPLQAAYRVSVPRARAHVARKVMMRRAVARRVVARRPVRRAFVRRSAQRRLGRPVVRRAVTRRPAQAQRKPVVIQRRAQVNKTLPVAQPSPRVNELPALHHIVLPEASLMPISYPIRPIEYTLFGYTARDHVLPMRSLLQQDEFSCGYWALFDMLTIDRVCQHECGTAASTKERLLEAINQGFQGDWYTYDIYYQLRERIMREYHFKENQKWIVRETANLSASVGLEVEAVGYWKNIADGSNSQEIKVAPNPRSGRAELTTTEQTRAFLLSRKNAMPNNKPWRLHIMGVIRMYPDSLHAVLFSVLNPTGNPADTFIVYGDSGNCRYQDYPDYRDLVNLMRDVFIAQR